MQTFRLFVDSDKLYACAPASIGAAREYSRLLVQSAPVPASERYAIADAYGWPPADVSDAVKHEEYQIRRACLLFPGQAEEIRRRADFVNVEEVGKAEAFFTRASGIRLREPAVSLNDLSSFLTQAISNMPEIRVTQQTGD